MNPQPFKRHIDKLGPKIESILVDAGVYDDLLTNPPVEQEWPVVAQDWRFMTETQKMAAAEEAEYQTSPVALTPEQRAARIEEIGTGWSPSVPINVEEMLRGEYTAMPTWEEWDAVPERKATKRNRVSAVLRRAGDYLGLSDAD